MEKPHPTFQVNGAALRRHRMRQGLSIKQVASVAGISRSYLSHLEIGARTRMSPGAYVRLREALRAHDDSLLARPEDAHREEEHAQDPRPD